MGKRIRKVLQIEVNRDVSTTSWRSSGLINITVPWRSVIKRISIRRGRADNTVIIREFAVWAIIRVGAQLRGSYIVSTTLPATIGADNLGVVCDAFFPFYEGSQDVGVRVDSDFQIEVRFGTPNGTPAPAGTNCAFFILLEYEIF